MKEGKQRQRHVQKQQQNGTCQPMGRLFPYRNQLFSFFLIVLFSILINIIYFQIIYLPQQSQFKSKKPTNEIISYEHVVFPPMNSEYNRAHPQQDSIHDDVYQLDYDKEKEKEKEQEEDKKRESKMAIHLAMQMQSEGKLDKAAKIYNYALSLDPDNIEALTYYGEYLELHQKDIIKAEHFYTKAVNKEPSNNQALLNLRRTLPLVNKLDRIMFDELDSLLKEFYKIPVRSSALKRAKREAYFMHIYHTNAIEGNTLNLQQTRHIVENRMAINGKSLIEHQEVLGLDAALRFINETLLYRVVGELSLNDILDIHRRVLGFSDPIESGKLREHQVYVGHFVPPAAHQVDSLMNEFIEWLNDIMSTDNGETHPVQIAALAHYKFVYIHPFYDGNGRTARLLMNLILMKSGYPPVIIRKEERLQYYEYLEQANQGDLKPFIRFISRCTHRTLQEYIQLCNNTRVGISTTHLDQSKMIAAPKISQKKILLVLNKKEKKRTKKDCKNSKFYEFIKQICFF